METVISDAPRDIKMSASEVKLRPNECGGEGEVGSDFVDIKILILM